MLSQEELSQLTEAIVTKIKHPKEWLSKEDIMEEFGIKRTLLSQLINDKSNPLPYTTFGDKKQLFHRDDINNWLRARMRNVG